MNKEKREFYAVIHAVDSSHGFDQANEAIHAGADGIALIDQYCDDIAVEFIARDIRRTHPRVRVLVNLLNETRQAIRMASLTVGFGHTEAVERCGVWTDSFALSDFKTFVSDSVNTAVFTDIPFFGGIGFKYKQESDLAAGFRLATAVELSRNGPFVPMTSGSATGQVPDVFKIKSYRDLLPEWCPLAIASGITMENIGKFMPYATHFLVGTSIEQNINGRRDIISERVREIASIVREFNAKIIKYNNEPSPSTYPVSEI